MCPVIGGLSLRFVQDLFNILIGTRFLGYICTVRDSFGRNILFASVDIQAQGAKMFLLPLWSFIKKHQRRLEENIFPICCRICFHIPVLPFQLTDPMTMAKLKGFLETVRQICPDMVLHLRFHFLDNFSKQLYLQAVAPRPVASHRRITFPSRYTLR